MLWILLESSIIIIISRLTLCFGEFEYVDELVNFETAVTGCSSKQKIVAKIDSSAKWIEMFNLLTQNGRTFPSKDIYIGLIYDDNLQVHKWMDGTKANWTKWYTNEPYNIGTRKCVRLGVDVDLHFRTTDCTYQHHYLCSTDSSVPVVVTNPTIQQETSGNEDMVIGLSAGFGAFAGIVGICCVLCWCCCSTKEAPKAVKYNTTRIRNPRMPNFNRHSPGANSYDTFVTSRSSRLDEYEMASRDGGVHKIEIDYNEGGMDYGNDEDNYLKIHCHNDDVVSMNDSSVSSKRSLESGRQTRSQDLLHYM